MKLQRLVKKTKNTTNQTSYNIDERLVGLVELSSELSSLRINYMVRKLVCKCNSTHACRRALYAITNPEQFLHCVRYALNDVIAQPTLPYA